MNVPYNALEVVAPVKEIYLSDLPTEGPQLVATIHTKPGQGFVKDPLTGKYLTDEQGHRLYSEFDQTNYEIYDMEEQFAREDGLFTGTQGDLCLRLVVAMASTPQRKSPEGEKPEKALERLELDARLVFFGHKVWSTDTEPWDENSPDFSQTVPKKGKVIGLTKAFPKGKVSFFDNVVQLSKSMQVGPKHAWISADASCCGAGVDKSVLKQLAEKGILNPNIPIIVVNEANPVLEALVQLAPASTFKVIPTQGDFKVSLCTYLDLKVGAIPPWLLLSSEGVQLSSPVEALAVSPSPAFFLGNLVKEVFQPTSPLSNQLKAVKDTSKGAFKASVSEPKKEDLVIAEYEDGTNLAIAVGFYGQLLDALAQDLSLLMNAPLDYVKASYKPHVKWTRFTPFKLWLLFGPPLHLFDPDAVLVGVWRNVYDACRLEPGVPKLQQPARLRQGSPEETSFAKDEINKLTTSGWMSEDKRLRRIEALARPVQYAQQAPPQRKLPQRKPRNPFN